MLKTELQDPAYDGMTAIQTLVRFNETVILGVMK